MSEEKKMMSREEFQKYKADQWQEMCNEVTALLEKYGVSGFYSIFETSEMGETIEIKYRLNMNRHMGLLDMAKRNLDLSYANIYSAAQRAQVRAASAASAISALKPVPPREEDSVETPESDLDSNENSNN